MYTKMGRHFKSGFWVYIEKKRKAENRKLSTAQKPLHVLNRMVTRFKVKTLRIMLFDMEIEAFLLPVIQIYTHEIVDEIP